MKTDNKLIAEFMGYRVFKKRYPRNHGIGAPEAEWKDCILEKTKYHTSWDWLMPVVEKINNTWSQYANENKLEPDNYPLEITMMRINIAWVKIGKVYQSVVEFIKWYNANKK